MDGVYVLPWGLGRRFGFTSPSDLPEYTQHKKILDADWHGRRNPESNPYSDASNATCRNGTVGHQWGTRQKQGFARKIEHSQTLAM